MSWIFQIFITATCAALIQLVSHWFPWRLLCKGDLPRLAAYSLGVFGFAVPLSFLFYIWKDEPPTSYAHLIALWAVISASGAAVFLGYLMDHILSYMRLADELSELLEHRHETWTPPSGSRPTA